MSKLIKLNNGQNIIISDIDYKRVNQHTWRVHTLTGYVQATINNKTILLHRFILNTPIGLVTDHINHNKLDNRRSNIRICNRIENQRNKVKSKTNKLEFKGIRFRKSWQATINVDNKQLFLGCFKDKIDAAKAYDKAAKKYFGKFALLNFK